MNDRSTIDDQFYELVAQGDPTNVLDDRLHRQLYVDKTLTSLYRRDDQHVSLLMLATLHGHEHLIHILLRHSSNMKRMVELKGSVFRRDGKFIRNATALWCACDRGYYRIARFLIEYAGAKVEHGPKYPLFIDAIIAGRLDTVRFLWGNHYVDRNPEEEYQHHKLNCLVMAIVHGHTEIVRYLLHQGWTTNYITSGHTPLGFAITRGHLEIVRLLCQFGANPKLKNSLEQTPLALAARYGQIEIVDYLFDVDENLKELELVACNLITPNLHNTLITPSQYQKMVRLMRKIFDIRSRKNLSKAIFPANAAYDHHQECQTWEEFQSIETNHERLFLETLLIRERLLHTDRDESIFKPLLVYGDQLVRRGEFDRCICLWTHTFYLYQQMNLDTGLHRFVWLLCRMITAKVSITAEQFLSIAQLVFQPSQQKEKDDCLKNALCLLTVSVKVLAQTTLTTEEKQQIYQWIFRFCQQKRRTSTGQTLLHLAVDIQTYFDINYRASDIRPVLTSVESSLSRRFAAHPCSFLSLFQISQCSSHASSSNLLFSMDRY